jgi:hypothetical protein
VDVLALLDYVFPRVVGMMNNISSSPTNNGSALGVGITSISDRKLLLLEKRLVADRALTSPSGKDNNFLSGAGHLVTSGTAFNFNYSPSAPEKFAAGINENSNKYGVDPAGDILRSEVTASAAVSGSRENSSQGESKTDSKECKPSKRVGSAFDVMKAAKSPKQARTDDSDNHGTNGKCNKFIITD